VINTDSHHTSHLEKMRFGVLQARRAWLTCDDVLNTLPAAKFAEAMRHHLHVHAPVTQMKHSAS
jgi:DNA polymerase (family 10)